MTSCSTPLSGFAAGAGGVDVPCGALAVLLVLLLGALPWMLGAPLDAGADEADDDAAGAEDFGVELGVARLFR